MKKINTLLFFVACAFFIGCDSGQNSLSVSIDTTDEAVTTNEIDTSNFGIVIHGGAGTILKKNMSDSMELAYRNKLKEAISIGHLILKEGGSAMEAVTATINVMEDSPLFNAGKGAVFTHEGKNELDASVMDGQTLNAGAVTGVTTIKNPINLAVEVMNNSKHVLLAGLGAEEFARTRGVEMMAPDYFYTERRYQSLQRAIKKEKVALDHDGEAQTSSTSSPDTYDPFIHDSKFGTVGCVVLDKNGNLAAGTSTGGMTNKRWNRIGDSPIIGAGTYANNNTCAVSGTGWGEYFMRGMVAYDIAAMMEYKKVTLQEAAKEVIQTKLTALGGTGGVVAIDHTGNVSMEFNTAGMYRAHMNAAGELMVKIYKED